MDNKNQKNGQGEELGKFKNIIEECEDYCLSIKKFEKEIEEQYKNLANIHQKNFEKNYLIEINDFEHFKEQINYNLFKTDVNNYRNEMLIKFTMIESENKEVKQEKLKQKVINSIGELFNLLKEGHQYILVNEEFSKNFVENKDEANYSYSLNSKELIINIKEPSLSFEHNKNIINYISLKNKESEVVKYQGQDYLNDLNSIKDYIKDNNRYGTLNGIQDYIKDETNLNNNGNNNNNIIKIEDNFELLDWFVKYYLEEKKFKTTLISKEKNPQCKLGFLIEQNEYNKWEKKMNLASLRYVLKEYIKEDEKKENLSEDEKKQIIQVFKNNNITHKYAIQCLKFKSIEEVKSFNRTNNLIFISKELFFLINDDKEKNNNENEIQYAIQEKAVDIIINEVKYSFNRYDNLIISYIHYNFYLITKIYIYQQALNTSKKTSMLYILNKEMFQKYKECFNYKILMQLMKNNNFVTKENEKHIFDFIEKIPDSCVNSIKQNINSFKLDLKAIPAKIVKNNGIDFAYLYDYDLLFLEGGTFIKFCKINEMNKELKKIIKLFFIKEKILFIFEHENKSYGQIGNIHNTDDEKEFVIDYLISVKVNKTNKSGTAILNDILKEEKGCNNFYDFIYKTNHEEQFEYNISDKLIFYVLNFKNNNGQNPLKHENPFFVNNPTPNAEQQQTNNIYQNNINIPSDNNIQNNNFNNNFVFNNQVQPNGIFTSNSIEQNNINNTNNNLNLDDPSQATNPFRVKENITNDNGNINTDIQQNMIINPFHIPEQQNNNGNNGKVINMNLNVGNNINNELNGETKVFLNNLGNININNNTQMDISNNNVNNAINININVNPNPHFDNNNINNNSNFNQNYNNQMNINNNMNNMSNNHNNINNNIYNNITNNPNNNTNNNIYNTNNQISNNINQNQVMVPQYDFSKIYNYLCLIISFIQSDQMIKLKINNSNFDEENLYLINNQWLLNFFQILKTCDINNIILCNPNIMSFNDKISISQNIFGCLSDNTKQYLNNLDFNYLLTQLNNNMTFIKQQNLNLNGGFQNIFFNFYLLGEDFVNSLSQFMNIDLKQCLMKSECVLLNQNIYAFTNNNNMYIGQFGTDYIFYPKVFACYQNNEVKNEIKNLVQTDGINFLNFLYFSGELIQNSFNFHIININQFPIKKNPIIDRLKVYIEFDNFKEKLINDTNNNNGSQEEIVLINKNLLDKINYNYIINIIDKYTKQIGKIDDIKNLLSNIIPNLSYEDIQLLKQGFNQINFGNLKKDDILSKPEYLESFENKKISVYNDFLAVKKDIIKIITKNEINHKYLYKILSGKGINIIVINNNDERTLLIGNILNKENTFTLLYILNFKYSNDLETSVEKIKKDHIDYLKKYLMFENDDFKVSPIFDMQGKIIGYGYKYDDKLLYNSITDYYLCDNLKNVILLFNYFNYLNNITNDWNNIHTNKIKLEEYDYCLVNKKWVQRFKETFRYENISTEINSGKDIENIIKENNGDNFESNDKKIFSILNKLNVNNYLDYNNDLKNKKLEGENYDFSPDLTSTGYIDSRNIQHQIFVLNEFEILPKKLIEKYVEHIGKTFSSCYIMNSYIIINFPKDSNGNNKYISLIGQIDFYNSLEIKTVLIYYHNFQKNKIIDEENNDLKKLIGIKEKRYFFSKSESYDTQEMDECFAFDFIPNKIMMNNDNNNFQVGNNNNGFNNGFNNDDNNGFNNDDNKDDNVNDENEFVKVNVIEYCLDSQVMYPYVKNNFQYPPLKGLDNIGATCYMNATLQCFCNIEQFVNFLKYDKSLIYKVQTDIGKKTLSSSFKLLIEKLWPNDYMNNTKKSYSPYEFKAKISYMNELFKGVAANDSKDLVNFIIMTLHEELNMATNQIVDNTYNINQTDMVLMYNSFTQVFNANNQSEISRLFYAFNYNVTQCSNCHTKSYNFQTYFFLIFPLEEIRKFKLNNNQFNNFNNIIINNNEVNIYDCLNYDRKENIMDGSNMMYCNYCKLTCPSSMSTHLCTGPEILIIILNRGKGIEFNVKINFFETLDLSGYIGMPNTGCYYNLIGVITHIGESGMGGHFIAYCRNPINYQWNKYNDSIVSSVNDFKSEVIDFAMPYLLFYQKQH